MTTVYDFSVLTLDQQPKALSDYRGKVLLIVNTASYCGFTPQYRQLQSLYEKINSQNFEILAFPCNQFLQQEPKSNLEIAQFCETEFHVTFPLFAKIEVNGQQASPLYKYLKQQCRGFLGTKLIKWNFTKFLINKEGVPVKRYAPFVSPLSLTPIIQQYL